MMWMMVTLQIISRSRNPKTAPYEDTYFQSSTCPKINFKKKVINGNQEIDKLLPIRTLRNWRYAGLRIFTNGT